MVKEVEMKLLTDEEIKTETKGAFSVHWQDGNLVIPPSEFYPILQAQYKKTAEEVLEWLEEHNCQITENPVYGLLLDNDDWQELRKQIEGEEW